MKRALVITAFFALVLAGSAGAAGVSQPERSAINRTLDAFVDSAVKRHDVARSWNLGRIAGAGVIDHVHEHVVPRWAGDTNFMPVLADVKVLPEHLTETRERLAAAWPR